MQRWFFFFPFFGGEITPIWRPKKKAANPTKFFSGKQWHKAALFGGKTS